MLDKAAGWEEGRQDETETFTLWDRFEWWGGDSRGRWLVSNWLGEIFIIIARYYIWTSPAYLSKEWKKVLREELHGNWRNIWAADRKAGEEWSGAGEGGGRETGEVTWWALQSLYFTWYWLVTVQCIILHPPGRLSHFSTTEACIGRQQTISSTVTGTSLYTVHCTLYRACVLQLYTLIHSMMYNKFSWISDKYLNIDLFHWFPLSAKFGRNCLLCCDNSPLLTTRTSQGSGRCLFMSADW